MLEITKDQQKIIKDESRYKVIVAGRRWGKTHLALFNALINYCWKKKRQRVWFVAPTYKQAKNIAWIILKEICYEYPMFLKDKNESELWVEFINGSRLELKGADKEDSLRGVGLNHVIMDEFAFMKKEAYTEVIRPALSDRKGTACFIGTPDGFNYFYDIYQHGLNQENGFKSWHFKSIDSPYLDPNEIEDARRELDPRTFRQEYEATFETMTGRVYYGWDRELNNTTMTWNTKFPLKLMVDFNVNPMKWALGQEIRKEIYIIGEVIEHNTYTQSMARAVGERYGFDTYYQIYGDYTGTARSTKARTTDYEIIQSILTNSEVFIKPNPPIHDRVNSVNALLCNSKNERRLFINISLAPHAVKDFEQVVWHKVKREPDQTTNSELTHISSAIGYYCDYEHSLKGKIRSKQW